MKRRVITFTFLALMLIGATVEGGCSTDEHRGDASTDLIEVTDPESITVYRNADGHPNINVVCIDGIAFVTTSNSVSYGSNGATSSSGRSASGQDLSISQILCGEPGQR